MRNLTPLMRKEKAMLSRSGHSVLKLLSLPLEADQVAQDFAKKITKIKLRRN